MICYIIVTPGLVASHLSEYRFKIRGSVTSSNKLAVIFTIFADKTGKS